MTCGDLVSIIRSFGSQGVSALHPNIPFLWVPALVMFIIYSQFSAGLSPESEAGVMAMEFQAARTFDGQIVEVNSTLLAIPSAAEPFSMEFRSAPTRINVPVDSEVLSRPSNRDALRIVEKFVELRHHLQDASYPLLVTVDSSPVSSYFPTGRPSAELRPLRIGQESLSLMLLAMFSAPIFSFGVAVCFLQNSIIIAKKNARGGVHEEGREQNVMQRDAE